MVCAFRSVLPCRIQTWGLGHPRLQAECRRCPSQFPNTCPEVCSGTWPLCPEASEELTPCSNPENFWEVRVVICSRSNGSLLDYHIGNL